MKSMMYYLYVELFVCSIYKWNLLGILRYIFGKNVFVKMFSCNFTYKQFPRLTFLFCVCHDYCIKRKIIFYEDQVIK